MGQAVVMARPVVELWEVLGDEGCLDEGVACAEASMRRKSTGAG